MAAASETALFHAHPGPLDWFPAASLDDCLSLGPGSALFRGARFSPTPPPMPLVGSPLDDPVSCQLILGRLQALGLDHAQQQCQPAPPAPDALPLGGLGGGLGQAALAAQLLRHLEQADAAAAQQQGIDVEKELEQEIQQLICMKQALRQANTECQLIHHLEAHLAGQLGASGDEAAARAQLAGGELLGERRQGLAPAALPLPATLGISSTPALSTSPAPQSLGSGGLAMLPPSLVAGAAALGPQLVPQEQQRRQQPAARRYSVDHASTLSTPPFAGRLRGMAATGDASFEAGCLAGAPGACPPASSFAAAAAAAAQQLQLQQQLCSVPFAPSAGAGCSLPMLPPGQPSQALALGVAPGGVEAALPRPPLAGRLQVAAPGTAAACVLPQPPPAVGAGAGTPFGGPSELGWGGAALAPAAAFGARGHLAAAPPAPGGRRHSIDVVSSYFAYGGGAAGPRPQAAPRRMSFDVAHSAQSAAPRWAGQHWHPMAEVVKRGQAGAKAQGTGVFIPGGGGGGGGGGGAGKAE